MSKVTKQAQLKIAICIKAEYSKQRTMYSRKKRNKKAAP